MCATQPQSAEVLAVLCDFQAAQEKRVRQYVRFNDAFTDYLRSKDEAPFRHVMVETTREFAEVNESVRAAEARLSGDLARPDLAAHLRLLQEAERAKLKFTLVHQALKREASQERFSWQRGEEAQEQSTSLGDTPSEGAHANGYGHFCSLPPEPTEEEFTNALTEATLELQAAVTSINDTLMELREAEEELREDAEI
ncbi:hypothetical protein WJX75_006673 [Coccomyxa subellipsoidea]|uniref:Uncharacterized protein n=1 Tax=Coccomyxa subellipsoidea TaxID=248742 RepID=A0ABR2YSM8_9CHLO